MNRVLAMVFGVGLLVVHVIAMAMAAQLYDRDFEGTVKEEDFGNAATPFVQAWNLLGFCGGAAFAVVLLRAQDGNQGVYSAAGLAITTGLIELGFSAKQSKLGDPSPFSLGARTKNMAAFGIISGIASAAVGVLALLTPAGSK